MIPVTVYVTNYCVYCLRAKRLLERKGIAYTEIDVSDDPERRSWLVRTTGRRTVPQIFVGETPVGGFTELYALDRDGSLDRLLSDAD